MRTRWGVGGAMVAALGLALSCAFSLPTFAGSDEAAHYSYAIEVGHGRLPTIDTPMPTHESRLLRRWLSISNTPDRRRSIWVANHPPLYYAIAAPVEKVADATGGESSGFDSMRVLSAIFAALSVGATALFAREAFGDDPLLVVTSAAMAAALPYVVATGGLAYNDTLGLLLCTGALAVAARIVRRGPSWPRVATATVVVAAAALTRAELLLLAPLMLAAFCVSAFARPGRPTGRVLARQLACLAVVPVAVTAWFYVRNQDLYGSWTGSDFLLQKFHRSPQLGSVFDALWQHQLLERMWTDIFTSAPTLTGTFRTEGIFGGSWLSPNWRSGYPVLLVVLGLALLGALRAAVRRIRAPSSLSPGDRRWLAFVAVLAGYFVLVSIAVTQSVAAGHTPWARYLFPAVPLVVLATAWGVHQLWSSRWLLVAVVTVMFLVEAVVLVALLPRHLLYPYIGMGAPGIVPVGRELGRVVALAGGVTALIAIARPTRTPTRAAAVR